MDQNRMRAHRFNRCNGLYRTRRSFLTGNRIIFTGQSFKSRLSRTRTIRYACYGVRMNAFLRASERQWKRVRKVHRPILLYVEIYGREKSDRRTVVDKTIRYRNRQIAESSLTCVRRVRNIHGRRTGHSAQYHIHVFGITRTPTCRCSSAILSDWC